jgi:hypothetical protein
MGALPLILLALAFACFIVATIWVPPAPPGRPHFGWLGLAFWVLAEIVTRTMK